MIKIFLTLFLILNSLKAADSSTFSDKQQLLVIVKEMIQAEESIARAYESYIINEKKIPEDYNSLLTEDYLGTNFKSIPEISNFSFDFKKELTSRVVNTSLESDTSALRIYESDLFRKKTYYTNNATTDVKSDDTIVFKLEDEFVNHLYFLSSTAGFDLIECGSLPKKKYCWNKESDDENVIYIYTDDTQTDLLMYYSIDKFKTGPIIITSDTSLHVTSEEEFSSIPKGALLYDTDAVKYIKTSDSLEAVK